MNERGRTVVLGLGNPVRGDDAVGLRVADAVDALLRERPLKDVSVATSTRAGLEVVELLAGTARAVIVDCLVAPRAEPGRVRRLALADCSGSARLTGAHDVTLAQAFALARSAGVAMPDDVRIYGIEAAEECRLAEELSPAVEEAARRLARQIHEELTLETGSELRPSRFTSEAAAEPRSQAPPRESPRPAVTPPLRPPGRS